MGNDVFTPDDDVLKVSAGVGMLVTRDVRVKSRMVREMRCQGKNMLVGLNPEIDERLRQNISSSPDEEDDDHSVNIAERKKAESKRHYAETGEIFATAHDRLLRPGSGKTRFRSGAT